MKLLRLQTFILVSFIVSGFITSCNTPKDNDESESDSTAAMEADSSNMVRKEARAIVSSASGSEVTGEATFTDLGDGDVTFKLTVEKATPGEHAVHLHESGDCSAPDATSSGGHWNPEGMKHGKRAVDMQFHAGDIANLEVGEDSTGVLTMTVSGWSVGGPDSTNVINKAIIIHASADDFESQPSGAAGKRVACGVIQLTD